MADCNVVFDIEYDTWYNLVFDYYPLVNTKVQDTFKKLDFLYRCYC